MLAAAVALHEGFHYQPDGELFWKQSVGNENSYLFVTTRHLNSTYLDSIKDNIIELGNYKTAQTGGVNSKSYSPMCSGSFAAHTCHAGEQLWGRYVKKTTQ